MAEIANYDVGDDLPETIDITQDQIDRYFTVWTWWRATEKKHLISDILAEPHEPMNIVLTIDNLFEKIVKQLTHKDANDRPSEN